MNVYDFDGTLYNGDSSIDFYFFSLKKKHTIIRYVPKQAAGFLLYALRQINKKELKERFFCFLCEIDGEQYAEEFWRKNSKKIRTWYLGRQCPDDTVISASPEFLLQPICRSLGIKHLIASSVQITTGRFLGENCYGIEKLRRWKEASNNSVIDYFYSDSYSDEPLALFAKNAFLLQNGVLKPWKTRSKTM